MQPEKNVKPSDAEKLDEKKNDASDPGHTKEAYTQAEEDIEMDPDFMPGNEADDLDEAESVKLNDDENDLV